MIGGNIFQMIEKLGNYIQSTNQIEPFIFIYGEKEDIKKCEIRQLGISSNIDILELKELLKILNIKLHSYIESEEKIKNFDENGDFEGLFYKFMNKNDLERINSLPFCLDNKTNFNEFTKTKYSNVYLIIELNLGESGEKKLLLFKSVKKHYSIKSDRFKNFISVPLFDQDETHKIKFIDSQNQLILDDNFEIIAFVNESVEISDIPNKDIEDSFFIIRNRKKFEDFYRYHESYEKAFTSLSSRFDFIDWNIARESISMKRSCYVIDNFPYLEDCISQLKVELISENENEVKKAFSAKGINYVIEGKNIKITPRNVIAFRSLFKIMEDVLSTTCLLNRSMLGEEELIVPQ